MPNNNPAKWDNMDAYCAYCGGKIEPEESFCAFCGRKIDRYETIVQRKASKSKISALGITAFVFSLLGLFLALNITIVLLYFLIESEVIVASAPNFVKNTAEIMQFFRITGVCFGVMVFVVIGLACGLVAQDKAKKHNVTFEKKGTVSAGHGLSYAAVVLGTIATSIIVLIEIIMLMI